MTDRDQEVSSDGGIGDLQWSTGAWGKAASLGVRLIYFSPAASGCPIGDLRKALAEERSSAAARPFQALAEPAHSMHEDIVAPQFATDERLPLILACEAFPPDPGPDGQTGRRVRSSWRPGSSMEWEGRQSVATFPSDRTVEAELIDGFCLFEDGRIAYYVSFVIEEDGETPFAFPAPLALVLASAWANSAGRLVTADAVGIGWRGRAAHKPWQVPGCPPAKPASAVASGRRRRDAFSPVAADIAAAFPDRRGRRTEQIPAFDPRPAGRRGGDADLLRHRGAWARPPR